MNVKSYLIEMNTGTSMSIGSLQSSTQQAHIAHEFTPHSHSSNNNNNNNTQKKNIGRNGRNELRVQKMKIVRNRNRTKAKDPRTVTKTHPHSETIIKRILKVPPYMCSFIVSLSKQLLYLRAFTNRNGFQRLF